MTPSGYLLGLRPEFLHEDRQRILLKTNSSIELQSVIRPAIEKFGFVLDISVAKRSYLDTLALVIGAAGPEAVLR